MKLLTFDDREVDVDVDLDNPSILMARVSVLSGDEVLSVLHRDGSESEYDACKIAGMWRTADWYDDSYIVVIDGKWMVDRDAFMNRKDSYWRSDE